MSSEKIKIGITGQNGFIGSHLYNSLGLYPDQFELIDFNKSWFNDIEKLDFFVKKCDVLIHLAALNRHNDPKIIYRSNIDLVKSVISSCEKSGSKPHIIFSSSTQEEKNNEYGESKKEGRKLFEEWAMKNNACFSGLIIPNVFGSFGNPYYNSVIATFCHQLTHNETPKIDVDGELKLIYVNSLIKEIINIIIKNSSTETIHIKHQYQIKVSELLEKLTDFKENYFEKGIIPDLDSQLDKDLFTTFLTYIDHKKFFPFKLKKNTDARGSFVETARHKSAGQVSFSTTVPGITRGNHFHTRKVERFAVIKGKALIELRKVNTDQVLSFKLDGDEPSFVDMPIWFTHNIKNIGTEDLYTIFWINEPYDQNDPDTFILNV